MTNQPLRRPRRIAALVAVLLAATSGPAAAQNNAPPPAAGNAPAPARLRGEPLTLNFVNAEIEGVSRAMSAILNRPILVDPRVKGTITLYSEQAVRPDEAYRSFLAALRGLGFTVVEVEGLLKVVPEADAKLQTGTVSIGDSVSRRGDQVLTQIFKLSHENANNLVPVLRPLISPNNTINATAGANTLVITDYADNLRRIAKIIAAMDTPGSGDVEVIPLQHAVASDIAPLVQRMSDSQAVPGVPGGAGGALQVLVEPRSNSLLVKAPTAARLASVRSLIDQLDRPLPGRRRAGQHLGRAPEECRCRQARDGAARRLQRRQRRLGGGSASGHIRPQHRQRRPRRRQLRHERRGSHTGRRVAVAVDRRLRAGRSGEQLADHHRAGTAVPPGARDDRPARFAARADLHRKHDRRGVGRQQRRFRLPVAGPDRQQRRQLWRGRRHQLVGRRPEHHLARADRSRRRHHPARRRA